MNKRVVRIIGVILLLTFVIMQFFRVDKSVPQHDKENDFITMTNPPQKVKSLLVSACYDCHSYETTYPWYSEIAPISWWLQDHINHGRDEMNFSIWGTYKAEKTDHKLEECIELVDEEKMPLSSYTWVHSDARITDEERKVLSNWFSELSDQTNK